MLRHGLLVNARLVRHSTSFRALSIDAAVADLVRKEIGDLKLDLAALRNSVARLEHEVASLRGEHDMHSPPTEPARAATAPVRAATAVSEAPRPLTTAGVPVLWHNPACTESCAALALLEGRASPFVVRDYLEEPPSFAELSTLKEQLNVEPIDWARTLEPAWCEHFVGISIYDDLLPDDDDILRAMVQFPIMIDRPILSYGTRAVVGKPPERILSLLDADASPD